MIDKKILTGLLAAFGASLCCITPVLAVLAGSTGLASIFTWMEPFRPYLIALTVIVLAYAWWDKLKPKKADIACACDADEEGKVSFWYSKTFLFIREFRLNTVAQSLTCYWIEYDLLTVIIHKLTSWEWGSVLLFLLFLVQLDSFLLASSLWKLAVERCWYYC